MSVTGQLRGSQNYIWSPTDVVGRGATGEVYRCRSKRNGEIFAVKTFNSYAYMRPRDVQKRELDVIQKLEHKNIVKTIGVEEELNTGQQVIIMEFCNGGSVYSVLDEPEFMYGMQEDEFLTILVHIADGMEYLKQNKVVHRDIKPGNILRLVTDEKRYIYKLSDFGAARELHNEDENFMSMHGTEEYLDPSVYERAVMGQGHGRAFDASVDLWSLGVTLYHIAVGQLPFRPFGGRRNKDTMFEIHTRKETGVISGVQETEGGEITWSRELPTTCSLSQGLRNLITPVMAGLLEVNPRQKWTFEDFFREVELISKKVIIYVFHTASCASLRIYANPTDSLAQVKELIAEQTDIPASNQHLLYDFRNVSDIVKGTQEVQTYPFTTTVDRPIFMFFDHTIVEFKRAQFYEIPKFPRFGTVFSLDNDAPLAKQCAALMFLIGRHIAIYNRQQDLLKLSVSMYMWQILTISRTLKGAFDQIQKPANTLIPQFDFYKEGYLRERRLIALMFRGRYKSPDNVVKFFQKSDTQMANTEKTVKEVVLKYVEVSKLCEEFHQKLVVQDELGSKWDNKLGCPAPERCNDKLSKLTESVDQTRVDFKRDKQLKRLTYNEEQIHKVIKNTMNTNCSTAVTMAQDMCYPQLKVVYMNFAAWFRKAQPVRDKLQKLAERVSSQLDKQITVNIKLNEKQKLHSENMERLIQQLETGVVKIGPGQLTVNDIPDEASGPSSTSSNQSLMSDYSLNLVVRLEQETSMDEDLRSLRQLVNENEESIKELQLNGFLDDHHGYQDDELGATGIK